ncbi:hypothetical protein [Streptomyces sioyaensis]|uniref:hypothetical protein n=1 Tax=Streptomyces sioyaensis TaxID=67364 RepID=UPI00378D3965
MTESYGITEVEPEPRPDAGQRLLPVPCCCLLPTEAGSRGTSGTPQETLLFDVDRAKHDGCAQRLEAFAEQHRERLEELLRACGPGSAPAAHGRYMLVGQPESLIICDGLRPPPFSCAAGGRESWRMSC